MARSIVAQFILVAAGLALTLVLIRSGDGDKPSRAGESPPAVADDGAAHREHDAHGRVWFRRPAGGAVATHLRGSEPIEHIFAAPWLRDDRKADEGVTTKHPLLVFLHGAGEIDTSLEYLHTCPGLTGALPMLSLLTEVAAARQPADDPFRWSVAFPHLRDEFAVLAPLSRGSWQSDDDCSHTLDLIDAVLREYRDRLDPTRVIVTGVSQGGFGAMRIATARPERFAGAAPLCGFGPSHWGSILAFHRVSTLFVHGANDQMVPVSASDALVSVFNGTLATDAIGNRTVDGRQPLLQYWRLEETADPIGYPGTGHAAWRNAYSDPRFWEWARGVRLQPPQTARPTASSHEPAE